MYLLVSLHHIYTRERTFQSGVIGEEMDKEGVRGLSGEGGVFTYFMISLMYSLNMLSDSGSILV